MADPSNIFKEGKNKIEERILSVTSHSVSHADAWIWLPRGISLSLYRQVHLEVLFQGCKKILFLKGETFFTHWSGLVELRKVLRDGPKTYIYLILLFYFILAWPISKLACEFLDSSPVSAFPPSIGVLWLQTHAIVSGCFYVGSRNQSLIVRLSQANAVTYWDLFASLDFLTPGSDWVRGNFLLFWSK